LLEGGWQLRLRAVQAVNVKPLGSSVDLRRELAEDTSGEQWQTPECIAAELALSSAPEECAAYASEIR
jgi:hypothetical protein